MADLLLIHGTWGRAASWHRPGGGFRVAAEQRGWTVHDFLWSGVLAGVPTKLPGDPAEAANGADEGNLLPWLDAGEKLAMFLKFRGLDRPCVLTHSHGIQVVTFSTWRLAEYHHAVSISGPIRRDMQRARRYAKAHIASWTQFADDTGSDQTIIEGEWDDGEWPLKAAFTLPEGETILTPGLGHSGFFASPPWWARALDLLEGSGLA